jgi:phosphonate transport system substrate-binding protein
VSRYLERTLGQKVTVVVPRNFREFFDATMRGDYDLAVAAPHFARVAQVDRNMTPLVTYRPPINGLFIAPMDTTLTSVRDVRERVVAFANPQSLVAMYGTQWLSQAGLEPGRDYEARGARTDLGVGRMLLSGDAVAAIMSNGEFRALPADESARLKVLDVFARIPNFVWVAHPRLDAARQAQIKAQLEGLFSDPQDGAAFARASGFTALVEIDAATMRELDGFTAATRRAMGPAN